MCVAWGADRKDAVLHNMTLKYLLIIDFPKFDPLTATGMALQYVEILGKNVKIYFP